MVLNFGGGLFVNLGSSNWFITFLGYVSPFRYAGENLLRTLLNGLPYKDIVCENLNYTYKQKCLPIIVGYTGFFFVLSWTVTVIKSKFL